MDHLEKVINKITEWAKSEDKIRAVILQGSLSRQDSDALSDIDINLYVTDTLSYTDNDSWISSIDNVWVYSPDQYLIEERVIPTRLVIYKDGVKVDFSLFPVELLEKLGQEGYYDLGYKVLLDKDNKTKIFKPATNNPVLLTKPTQEEFSHIIKEYWFEEYHVAKYLKRKDLWLVKFRDGSLKVYLLMVMEWYMLAKNNWDYDTKWTGKQIKKWLDPEIYDKLFKTYGHFDEKDSWDALNASNDVFREISKKTAKLLGYEYPEEIDKKLTEFTQKLHANSLLD